MLYISIGETQDGCQQQSTRRDSVVTSAWPNPELNSLHTDRHYPITGHLDRWAWPACSGVLRNASSVDTYLSIQTGFLSGHRL